MLKLPKEPSLGSTGGGAIPSNENRVTVRAWSTKTSGEGGEWSGGRGRAGFMLGFALTCCSAPHAWMPQTFRHRHLHATPKGPIPVHPVRGLTPVWAAGWAEVQQDAF